MPLTIYTVPAKLVGLFTIEETVEVYTVADVEARELKWSSERPTVPGWYWWRGNGMTEVVKVYQRDAIVRLAFMNGNRFVLAHITAVDEWAGPLVPPEERRQQA